MSTAMRKLFHRYCLEFEQVQGPNVLLYMLPIDIYLSIELHICTDDTCCLSIGLQILSEVVLTHEECRSNKRQ